MAPKDENELRHMTRTLVDYNQGPIALRFPRGEGLGVPLDAELKALPIGKAEVVREGRDIVFFAIGAMVHPCVLAAEQLAARGVEAGVVNARFVKPLDTDLIDRVVAQGTPIVTVEDNALAGGFGSGVNEYLVERGFDIALVRNLGLPDRFIEHGERGELLAELGLGPDAIAESAAEFLAERRRTLRSAAR
jgi:1-deoxy-D-xylulose-5-phosphate synthase